MRMKPRASITPRAVAGDKGYDAKANRSAARERSMAGLQAGVVTAPARLLILM